MQSAVINTWTSASRTGILIAYECDNSAEDTCCLLILEANLVVWHLEVSDYSTSVRRSRKVKTKSKVFVKDCFKNLLRFRLVFPVRKFTESFKATLWTFNSGLAT